MADEQNYTTSGNLNIEKIAALSRQPTVQDFSQNSQFKVTLGNYPLLEWFCTSVSLPGVSLGRYDQGTRLATIPRVGDNLTFDDITFTFLVDEKLQNYQEIFNWMVNIGFPSNHVQFNAKDRVDKVDRGGELSLYSDLHIAVLSNKNNPVVRLTFHDAWPVSLGGLEYTSQDTDAAYLNADVTFAYSYYEFLNL